MASTCSSCVQGAAALLFGEPVRCTIFSMRWWDGQFVDGRCEAPPPPRRSGPAALPDPLSCRGPSRPRPRRFRRPGPQKRCSCAQKEHSHRLRAHCGAPPAIRPEAGLAVVPAAAAAGTAAAVAVAALLPLGAGVGPGPPPQPRVSPSGLEVRLQMAVQPRLLFTWPTWV